MSLGRQMASDDQFEKRGLSGTVRADQAVQAAFLNTKIQIVDDCSATESFGQTTRLE